MWNRQFTRLRILDLHQYKSAIQSEWRQYQWKILFSLFSLLLLFSFINGIEPPKWTKHNALCFDLIHLKHFTVSFLSSSLMLITQNASGVFPRPQHKWHSVIKSNIFVNESRFQILLNYHFFSVAIVILISLVKCFHSQKSIRFPNRTKALAHYVMFSDNDFLLFKIKWTKRNMNNKSPREVSKFLN